MENTTIASLQELLLSTSDVTSANDGTTAPIDDPYYVSPGFSTLVFDACTGIMIITGIVGVIANFGIIMLFIICPHVSFRGSMLFSCQPFWYHTNLSTLF